MTTGKRYELLHSLPAYGPMYVPVTISGEPFYSEGLVVRFYKTDGSNWVANFQPGWTDLNQIIELANSRNILVIAFGACYLIDPNDTTPAGAFGVGYAACFTSGNGRIVLTDLTHLAIMEPNGDYWETERISWDGFAEITVENNIVTGLAYNPTYDGEEWIGFMYNLDTKTLAGGSHREPAGKKPWWKIW